jgi:hypothetical protein
MEKLSSAQTWYTKRVFPVFWFGFLALFFGIALTSEQRQADPMIFVVPVVMAVFGFVLFRKLIWDLADEVRDGGSYLLVRKGDIEERIALASIMNVEATRHTNPTRVTLRLRTPGKLGDQVVFIPRSTFQLNPFARNQVAEALIRRIDQLRQHARQP